MVICPVALAVGCRKCPIFKVCPVKTVIGDYVPPSELAAEKAAPKKVAARKTRSRKKKSR